MKPRLPSPFIDPKRPLNFRFDGRQYRGFAGDNLASALLANGVRVVGRSFKYHRPRGVMADGVDEANALVSLYDDGAWRPNLRATEIPLFEGLEAHSQNRYPSLRFDLLAVNDWLAPFIGAGFYYKTFKYPKKFWEALYEPAIRRAAGLGKLPKTPASERYAKGFLHCELLVIGGGLAGLMAAYQAAQRGVDVIVAETEPIMGGHANKTADRQMRAAVDHWLGRLGAMENVRLMANTTVTGRYDGGVYGALETTGWQASGDAPQGLFWRINAQHAYLATGALERPIAFRDNDRPGVMQAGAVRGYLNRFGVLVGQRIAIFTNNDSGWDLARELVAMGQPPVALIDPRGDRGHVADFPVFAGMVTRAIGRQALRALEIRTDAGQVRLNADILAVSGGWNPNIALGTHLGARPVWRGDLAAFTLPPIDDLTPIGAAAGLMEASQLTDMVGQTVAAQYGGEASGDAPELSSTPYTIEPLWQVAGKGRAWVDFQNDVTVKDIALAHRENFTHVEHMKRYTTLGMATDQGRTANVNGLAIMAELTGKSIADTGTTNFRAPYTPMPMGALGAGGAGQGFMPHRDLPSRDFNTAAGAPTIEAGLWHRPSYFPKPGERHWRQSTDREVMAVRGAVGVSDVSSLGKIELVGRDAGAFLDFVYINAMSSLKIGQIRYGLMLREDGFVMDDGTCARLGEDRFLLTTTTAAAGEVFTHLEFVHQCLRPDMDVRFVSVSDHYAQFAIAGPRARELLSALVAGDISNEAMPFMRYQPVQIGRVAARLYRISFSGELGYEIALPRRFGRALFGELVRRARELGGDVYGIEALNVMRIEKGFITHAEIHGRVTAQDVGLGAMLSPRKDYIGRIMAHRPHLINTAEREQLVGIRPVGTVQKLLAGSRMVDIGAAPVRENLRGSVTSVCYSPTLGQMIGLAFVKNGRARLGEEMRAVDLIRDFDTRVRLVDPVFYDPEGGRMRG